MSKVDSYINLLNKGVEVHVIAALYDVSPASVRKTIKREAKQPLRGRDMPLMLRKVRVPPSFTILGQMVQGVGFDEMEELGLCDVTNAREIWNAARLAGIVKSVTPNLKAHE